MGEPITERLRAHMGKADIGDVLPDCREAADTIDALVKALEDIAAMDPKGIRADDLGRAARTASEALSRAVSSPGEPS